MLSTTLTCFAKKASKPSVIRVEVETKDEFVLVGDLYPSKVKKEKKPLVVFLHSIGGKSSDWGDLPKEIRKGGNNVFALDFRGHGRSVYKTNLTYHSRNYFSKDEWQKFPTDVVEAIKYLKEHYSKIDYNNIIFVGADLGANSAVLAGERLKPKPTKLIMITPAQEIKGLHIPLSIANYDETPMMILVSQTDRYFYGQANLLAKFIQTESLMRIFPTGGSGTTLLKQNPSAKDDIYKYIYDISIDN
jgi:alpha-beta hydrolase superfamily lysophospholipase